MALYKAVFNFNFILHTMVRAEKFDSKCVRESIAHIQLRVTQRERNVLSSFGDAAN